MNKVILYIVILLFSFITKTVAQTVAIKDSVSWSFKQNESQSYEIGPTKDQIYSNQEVYTIKSIKSKIERFGNIMKTVDANPYQGKTVKMTGYVKSENVKSWAGMWMRVDFYSSKELAFDNMQQRGIKGTTDWTKYEVVLFVPEFATSISYGVLLAGTGQIWMKDISLEVVSDTVAETGTIKGRNQKSPSFEDRANEISNQIEEITTKEKEALKKEVEEIDAQIIAGEISAETGKQLKTKAASERANNIETKVAVEEAKLAQLVKDKVDGKLSDANDSSKRGGTTIYLGGNSKDSIGKNRTEINIGGMKIYKGEEDKMERKSRRTTSQFVFAMGINNVITEGENLENSDFRVLGSHFYEWGMTLNSRILKNNNLLHAKYGLSLQYNNLRPTDNRYFETNGNQTDLVVATNHLNDSRFRSVYLTAPVHLEFDFTPKKLSADGTKTSFRIHQSFRLGVGGYAGVRLKSKQIIKYELDDLKIKDKQKGDFNVSDFNYGLSAYVGYGQTSLYVKYDLNSMFKNNNIEQNNVSLGIRFDFN
ncbi:hypothetical protein ACFSX9_14575 [Flavobacterium ardleyense]|uniref:Outer membrane protein beta-barrel domain-containing protein n=1 Tax=Flavobacterium ardleyense TaxID=2038737 RepID=A0ABW5ZBG8_9FLAO